MFHKWCFLYGYEKKNECTVDKEPKKYVADNRQLNMPISLK